MTSHLTFLYNQFFITPPLPSTPLTDQTIIITGSNTGLGLAAAHQILALGAKKIILGVRNTTAGEIAAKSLDPDNTGVVEVWALDLASYESVLAFADRVSKTLERVDILIENAGVATDEYELAEGHERTVTVNVISTFLLAVLLLPVMRKTGEMLGPGAMAPRLCILASEVHAWTGFPQRHAEKVFDALDDMESYPGCMGERYSTSKLLDVLLGRELAERVGGKREEGGSGVVVNVINPGFCRTELSRNMGSWGMEVMKMVVGRTAEVGGRTLVAGAVAGWESHGQYMSNGVVKGEQLSGFVRSEEGREVQGRLWRELGEVLEGVSGGVMDGLW
ncbi:putative short-chain dehydrogenase/reductase family protein [Aspergillus sclerotiicarbonarius CBS 121057]|uniref:Putative short-chain dehydrogenase/reductase family protein n=1 Tax=Aspergillus sclerotiicarbonarius (strain CBS 121057 / IBT 28362) TaxID=1448318 RepID=A0A319DYC9_ASPSB|nr:putative short-chain dehydrogenase/reductase family protein [Aspergillus sclerotiicarbonarius CBS 121057]